MQYVRSISGSVSKTWNSINPATLSGAIDVIVVGHEDGSLACSPFHVRFGKVQVLRPSDKKVVFKVNDTKQDYSMKLGEGGEAFFVFETSGSVPEALQTSPLVSPAASPETRPAEPLSISDLPDPEPLDLAADAEKQGTRKRPPNVARAVTVDMFARSDLGNLTRLSSAKNNDARPVSGDWSGHSVPMPISYARSMTDELFPSTKDTSSRPYGVAEKSQSVPPEDRPSSPDSTSGRSSSPPPVSAAEARTRAINLSKKLWGSNIATHVTDNGDLMLDMTGYKSSEEESLRAEAVARRILAEEIEGNYDIGALIGVDDKGNIWIYSSEEAKEAAGRRSGLHNLSSTAMMSTDAVSDPGYHSDDTQSDGGLDYRPKHPRRDSDSAVELTTPESPNAGDSNRNYAKTLRLTSDQLRAMNLKPGANTMSFSVNKAVCQAYIYLWRHDVPIVISDIDGTITKSDALGHVLNMIGRDWTHIGVAKLYTDIVSNGYNILYLTSRSVGQADSTRNYLNGVVQDGYKLPKGPVIMSPDRTIAALRREVYLRKPEVFKMACLRDIMNLFNKGPGLTPFYAGFGNRFTDALSYRSVNIPSTRIFTINSNAEVSLDLLSLNKYKTGYTSMREIVDHYFPPVTLLVPSGGEDFTDFNYWREQPLELDEFSASESENEESDEDEQVDLSTTSLLESRQHRGNDKRSLRSEDEGSEDGEVDDLQASMLSIDETGLEDSIMESIEGDPSSLILADEQISLERTPVQDDDDETELEDVEALDALDLSSNAKPRLEADGLRRDLKELAHVLSSPNRKGKVNALA